MVAGIDVMMALNVTNVLAIEIDFLAPSFFIHSA
ncbi:hypothetical protein SAMN04488004_13023 [Loktanella salsilacus]|jgi:hypothetical protein|uniref:Uncharacterized protein n=1 Tax=Loktanella salsilacus TaxID=195913 RepID=A0A1I4IYD1_9RHOB|nr:hypothetical protein SAMN04488004_13023 [Loktanella salsilacus]